MTDELDKREYFRTAYPDYGPDWQAAIDFGVDIGVLEYNLSLTPTERFEQAVSQTAFVHGLERAREKLNAGK